MKKFIIFVAILGVGLAVVGFWYWQRTTFSKEVVKLEILGHSETDAGQVIEYTVKYKNNGDINLQEARLVFEFPASTIVEEGQSLRQEIGSDQLGDIYPGEEKVFIFKGRLMGKEGDAKIAKASLSYTPKNLKASYESRTEFAAVIKTVPLTFDFDVPTKTQSGSNFKISLNYFSRFERPLNNLDVKVEYPSGFEFSRSNPKSMGDAEWEIPVLNAAEGGRIDIFGILRGDISEQKIIRATLGVWQGDNFMPLKDATATVEIGGADVYVYSQVNSQDKYVASPGDNLHYEIFFKNTTQSPFTNLTLVSRLEGRAFDFGSVRVNSGQISTGDNSIIFDSTNNSQLQMLSPGGQGKAEFWINLKSDWQASGSGDRNFIVRNTVSISGTQEQFDTKINSKLQAFQKIIYNDEVFGNSGPFPPASGQPTTFTIGWQAKNYYNDVKNVKIKATLPANIKLTGKVFPETETSNFAYDSASREIVWTVGDMASGQGVLNNAPSIFFQVELNAPYLPVQLIGDAKISGEDQWTGQTISSTYPGINTSSVNN